MDGRMDGAEMGLMLGKGRKSRVLEGSAGGEEGRSV